MARVLACGTAVPDPVSDVLGLIAQTRFAPIFAYLFGMSPWSVLDGARAPRPSLVMVRRLAGLAAKRGARALPGHELGLRRLAVPGIHAAGQDVDRRLAQRAERNANRAQPRVTSSAPKMSSNPTMLRSPGTRSPVAWAARSRPIAIRSL